MITNFTIKIEQCSKSILLNSGCFYFQKLPAAFFSGVRIKEVGETKCRVSVPYKWFTQNPFRSTYFACLAMAAEMSTGALGNDACL